MGMQQDWIGLSTWHCICHFGGGLHSQSLDCYWQTNNKENTQHKSQKYTHKHNTNVTRSQAVAEKVDCTTYMYVYSSQYSRQYKHID